MSNVALTSGFESVLIICSWLQTFVSIWRVFMKMFDMDSFHKMLNYAFLKIQTQYTRKFDAAICFFHYRLKQLA